MLKALKLRFVMGWTMTVMVRWMMNIQRRTSSAVCKKKLTTVSVSALPVFGSAKRDICAVKVTSGQ